MSVDSFYLDLVRLVLFWVNINFKSKFIVATMNFAFTLQLVINLKQVTMPKLNFWQYNAFQEPVHLKGNKQHIKQIIQKNRNEHAHTGKKK